MKHQFPLSTVILWSAAMVLVVVLVISLLPKRVDEKTIPPLDRLASTSWKADTVGGHTTLDEIGVEVTSLTFSDSSELVFLKSKEKPDKTMRVVMQKDNSCALFNHTADSGLRLTYETSPSPTLIITGSKSHQKLYFQKL